MLIHQLPLDAAFATLRSSAAGLSLAEAAARRVEFGPNRIERLPTAPVATRFVAQFTHFFAALLWVAACLAFVADRQMPGQGMATLAAAIVGVILVNGMFSFWQEYRAEQTMAALQRLLPHQVRVRRDGAVAVTPSEDVVPGDVILLSAGDCADGDLLRSRNVLLAGTAITTGEATALVFATEMHTVFGGIARLTQSTPDVPSALQKEIVALSRVIALLAVAIGSVVFAARHWCASSGMFDVRM